LLGKVAVSQSDPNTARKRWMAILARAPAAEIETLVSEAAMVPSYTLLRGPEVGLVMARGRAGGGGAPFNVGEITLTRCTVRSAEGRVGHAYVAGRDLRQAELAAALDAALQAPARHDAIQSSIIAPLATAQEKARAEVARKAAATRVQFFTMATMRS